jgi:hypothetical protein
MCDAHREVVTTTTKRRNDQQHLQVDLLGGW